MSNRLILANGRVLDPSQNCDQIAHIFIEDESIREITQHQENLPANVPVFDASGLLVLPGFIDMHVHLREPGGEHKETISTGTRAAVAGGFTSVACMANTNPVNDNAYVTTYIREKAKEQALCRVFPIGAVSKGLKGEELAEIGAMVDAGICAISDDGMPVMNSYLMRKAMDYAKAFHIPVITHSEDANLTGGGVMNEGPHSTRLGLRGNPTASEEIMVAREIALCRLTGCAVHVGHVSSALAIQHIRAAKKEGLPITAEVTPHHLCLTDGSICTYDTFCKMAPPLRSDADVLACQRALADGTIDAIATDHAPHALGEKRREFDQAPFGVVGLETALSLTYELVEKEKMSLNRWVDSLSSSPAKILNLPLGTLRVGGAADLTLFDPKAKWTPAENALRSKSKNSPFLGQTLLGRVKKTIVRGTIVYE